MNERHEELIQREIDGALSPQEQAELLSAAADDAETRAERERMLRLREDLDLLAWQDPDPELEKRVMAAIAGEPAPRRAGRRISWRPGPGHAVAFAAGIACILVLSPLLPLPGGEELGLDRVAGTLSFDESVPGEIARGELRAGESTLEAWTARVGEHLILRARGEGPSPSPVRIAWPDAEWAVVSIRSQPLENLGVDRGHARFEWTRPGSFLLEFEFQRIGSGTATGDVRLRFEDGSGASPEVRLRTSP